MKKHLKLILAVLIAAILTAGALLTGILRERASAPSDGVRSQTGASMWAAQTAADSMDAEAAYGDYGARNFLDMHADSVSGDAQPDTPDQRKLVRTISLSLSTRTYAQTAAHVRAKLAETGGYIEELNESGEEGHRRLRLSMRVPSERLDAFVESMAGSGRITSRSETTTDMTTRYQDNATRLKTLYDKRDRLNELMRHAENISDLIELESAIADTQYEIDSYETSQRTIDRQVSMSLVKLTVTEETPLQTAGEDESLLQRMQAGLLASVEWMGAFLQDMAVFVVMSLPVVLPLAAVLAVIWLIRKRKGK